MRIALLFSGQGGQTPAHLAALQDGAPPALSAALATALPAHWSVAAPEPALLNLNEHAQPLIYGYQIWRWLQLQPHLPKPCCVAGYSLGAMAASAVAGALPMIEGIALAAERARCMDAACTKPAGLLAVTGLNETVIADICQSASVNVAICNGPAQVILGGLASNLHTAQHLAAAAGATRVVGLPVTTPSHTPLLAGASDAFAARLSAWHANERLTTPLLRGLDGRVCYTKAEALSALSAEISQTLHWEACLRALVEMQPDRVLEIGPGNALCRMLTEFAPDLPIRSLDDFRTLEGVGSWLRR